MPEVTVEEYLESLKSFEGQLNLYCKVVGLRNPNLLFTEEQMKSMKIDWVQKNRKHKINKLFGKK